jgi:hypothetical protein
LTEPLADAIDDGLITAIERGLVFNGLEGAEMRPLKADWLRRILLGIPIKFPKPGDSKKSTVRTVEVRSFGIRIESARIVGRLDLDDVSGPGGSALPALRFDNCIFEDEDGISIRRCHLRSLTLINCQLHELQGEESIFDGPVKIRSIRRPKEISISDRVGRGTGTLGTYVVLRGAQIAGHVDCGESEFAATPRDEGDRGFIPHSKHARFALDLRAARINGSVLLRPDVKAFGGISVTLAQIQGSIWCQGADLVAIEDCAFSADYATVQGSVYLRARDRKGEDSVRFSAWGQVSLFAAKIGGSFYMEGASLQWCPPFEHLDGDEPFESLDATNATIGGNCKLCCWRPVTMEKRRANTMQDICQFEAAGVITLGSAVIRNGLYMNGANVGAVNAANIEIGGRCDMSAFTDQGYLTPEQSAQGCPRFTATAVHMEGAVIKSDWLMHGALLRDTITSADDTCGIFARGAKIGGDCQLSTFPYNSNSGYNVERFECFGRIAMQEAAIGNSLGLAGSRVVLKTRNQYAAIDISGTRIGGHAKLWTWKHRDTGGCIALEIESEGTGVRMAGTRIAQNLVLNGATITATKHAIYAPNLEVTGRASLATFPEDDPESCEAPGQEKLCRTYSFTSTGPVVFTAATFKLGLDMRGARLRIQPARACNDNIARLSGTPVLDLTLVRTKFLELTLTRHSRVPIGFNAVGAVKLEHAEIDTDVDLSRGRFQGRFVADHARIGASLKLIDSEFWSSASLGVYEMQSHAPTWEQFGSAEQKIRLREDLAEQHARRSVFAELSLRSASIGGDLNVVDPRSFQEFEGVDPARFPWELLKQFNYITVDLRGLHVEELNDKGGAGWSGKGSVRLWLDGFRYARLTPNAPEKLLVPNQSRNRGELTRPLSGKEVSLRRHNWLDLQYFDAEKPQIAEFTPGAYEQVVKVLNADGQYDDADRISTNLIMRENSVSPRLSRKTLGSVFGLLFRYGTSPRRAGLWFALFLLTGTVGAYVADYGVTWYGKGPASLGWIGKVLVMHHTSIEGGQAGEYSATTADRTGTPKDEPCDQAIFPPLYAVDVFVPVLNLHQQTACTIERGHWVWQTAQALYAIIGWIFVPMTLWTVSRVLKRRVEK